MQIQESVPLKSKTTMRIGGKARYYAELSTKQDVEAAVEFARENGVALIVLGGGSNTVFADDVIHALIVRMKASHTEVHGDRVTIQSGKTLAVLINELADQGFDLSPLTGIPGTVGGAIFGNAGQGPKGTWVSTFAESVTAYVGNEWKTLTREECHFRYRESWFKEQKKVPIIIWSATFTIPRRPAESIKADIELLLQKRLETQPHVKTAGSCFKAVGETPAWKLIDAAGFRGVRVGDVQIAEKHTNFLLNVGDATFEDTTKLVESVRTAISEPLEVEMRFYRNDGSLAF